MARKNLSIKRFFLFPQFLKIYTYCTSFYQLIDTILLFYTSNNDQSFHPSSIHKQWTVFQMQRKLLYMQLYSSSRVERVYLIEQNFGRFSSLFTTAASFNTRERNSKDEFGLEICNLIARHRENKVAALLEVGKIIIGWHCSKTGNTILDIFQLPLTKFSIGKISDGRASRKEIYDLASIQ